jgi:hypothetical protein
MPPTWWHPAHLAAMIGATSRVKLGATARAACVSFPRDAASAASGIARASSAAATIAIRTPLRMPDG